MPWSIPSDGVREMKGMNRALELLRLAPKASLTTFVMLTNVPPVHKLLGFTDKLAPAPVPTATLGKLGEPGEDPTKFGIQDHHD